MGENICKSCNCPIREKLDTESCWCDVGVSFNAGEPESEIESLRAKVLELEADKVRLTEWIEDTFNPVVAPIREKATDAQIVAGRILRRIRRQAALRGEGDGDV